jgi:hypothetical protein
MKEREREGWEEERECVSVWWERERRHTQKKNVEETTRDEIYRPPKRKRTATEITTKKGKKQRATLRAHVLRSQEAAGPRKSRTPRASHLLHGTNFGLANHHDPHTHAHTHIPH